MAQGCPDGSLVNPLIIVSTINKCIGGGNGQHSIGCCRAIPTYFTSHGSFSAQVPRSPVSIPVLDAVLRLLWGGDGKTNFQQLCVFRISHTDILFSCLPGVIGFKLFFGLFVCLFTPASERLLTRLKDTHSN